MKNINDINKNALDIVNILNSINALNGGEKNILEEAKIDNDLDDIIKLIANKSIYSKEVLEEMKEKAKNIICENAKVKMNTGKCLFDKKNFKQWYNAKKFKSNRNYWNRYEMYLRKTKGFADNVVKAIDQNTDEIVGLLGNPKQNEAFKRRGLVIGDVQSGKTATYIGIINKAVDAGYKTIILLTGTIEKLRSQTQERIDEGFVGRASDWVNNNMRNVGVGEIEDALELFPTTYTDINNDFNNNSGGRSVNLDNINDPAIFVLKKNQAVFDSLNMWLSSCSTRDKFESPLLLIDDEADNASINTNKRSDDPTTINKSIREILSRFKKSSYIAFTATPFANIFIEPDSEEDVLNDDLFPKDFIYVLEAPSNYISASSIFDENGKNNFMLKRNDDCESYIPLKHKKDYEPGKIPKSLEEAIISFMISCTIRDLRGDEGANMTMLVNISRFIDVQEKIREQIDEYLKGIRIELEEYSQNKHVKYKYEKINAIENVYEKHFNNINNELNIVSWEKVLDKIGESSAEIQVVEVNGKNPRCLEYDKENGIRVIAVGGLSLSRGLTLEGLSTSYFYRNSRMYDTLMQMGRWFGYRDTYKDLCQIWMSSESIGWYGYISEATDDLKNQVQKMKDCNKTPKEFGLMVRNDKDSLLVTAINKMRAAKDYERLTELSGSVIETPYFYSDKSINEKNIETTKKFIKNLIQYDKRPYNGKDEMALDKKMFLNVPKEKIIEYLKEYKCNLRNYTFDTKILVEYFQNENKMKKWDVLIANGRGETVQFEDFEIKKVLRNFYLIEEDESGKYSIVCSKNRLGSTGDTKAGLTKQVVNKIESEIKDRTPTSRDYFREGIKRKPLLIIYPTEFKCIEGEDEKIKKEIVNEFDNYAIGLAIGVPYISGKEKVCLKYKMNDIKRQEILGIKKDEEELEEI